MSEILNLVDFGRITLFSRDCPIFTKAIFQNTQTILTCYTAFIVVICLNLQASVRWFTSDTNWRSSCRLLIIGWRHLLFEGFSYLFMYSLIHLFLIPSTVISLQSNQQLANRNINGDGRVSARLDSHKSIKVPTCHQAICLWVSVRSKAEPLLSPLLM